MQPIGAPSDVVDRVLLSSRLAVALVLIERASPDCCSSVIAASFPPENSFAAFESPCPVAASQSLSKWLARYDISVCCEPRITRRFALSCNSAEITWSVDWKMLSMTHPW